MRHERIVGIKETADSKTPGTILRNLREKKHLTLKDIAKAIKIHPDIISALEHDNYQLIKNTTYVRGYLRLYAHFLKTPDQEILALFERLKVVEQTEIPPMWEEKLSIDKGRLLNFKKIAILLASIFFLIWLGYLAFHHGGGASDGKTRSARTVKNSADPATAPISILPPPVQDHF